MNAYEFIASLVGRVISWPVAVIVLGLLFRRPVLRMLGRVSRVSYPGGEAELVAAVEESARDLQDAVEDLTSEQAGRQALQQQIETVVRDAAWWGWRMARASNEVPELSISWSDGRPRLIFGEVTIGIEDRRALVALFAGYLEDPPRYDPHPKSYAAASARLGWTRAQMIRRIESIRARLTMAGVPRMDGPDALVNLAEYLITIGRITKDDLTLLPPDESKQRSGEG